jgi:hypothetical protein
MPAENTGEDDDKKKIKGAGPQPQPERSIAPAEGKNCIRERNACERVKSGCKDMDEQEEDSEQ